MWKSEERKTERTAPIPLPALDEHTLTALRRRYDDPSDAQTRTRSQILLLSATGQTSTQIAQIVLRSQDTVVHVLASREDWMPSPGEQSRLPGKRSWYE